MQRQCERKWSASKDRDIRDAWHWDNQRIRWLSSEDDGEACIVAKYRDVVAGNTMRESPVMLFDFLQAE